MKKLIEEVKKTVVFLGKIDYEGKPQFYATGFLVSVQNIFHLLTAKHVVVDMKTGELQDTEICAFFNSKDEGVVRRPIKDIKNSLGVNWIFHLKPEVDIAIIPFGLDPLKDDVKVIPDNLFLHPNSLSELYDVFFLSYQPGVKFQKRVIPILEVAQ